MPLTLAEVSVRLVPRGALRLALPEGGADGGGDHHVLRLAAPRAAVAGEGFSCLSPQGMISYVPLIR